MGVQWVPVPFVRQAGLCKLVNRSGVEPRIADRDKATAVLLPVH
jgi:hypothetical protein